MKAGILTTFINPILFTFIIMGCSNQTNRESFTINYKGSSLTSASPDWYSQPKQSTNTTLYAVAVAEHSSLSAATALSVSLAKGALCQKLNGSDNIDLEQGQTNVVTAANCIFPSGSTRLTRQFQDVTSEGKYRSHVEMEYPIGEH